MEKVHNPGMASWQYFNRSRVSNSSRVSSRPTYPGASIRSLTYGIYTFTQTQNDVFS